MAYAVTLTGTTLAKLQKKVQGTLLRGFQRKCEEWALLRKLTEFDLDFSAREVTRPIDIVRSTSGGYIPEGGYEMIPQTTAPEELTFTWANYNHRWSYTLTSQYLSSTQKRAELVKQSKYQALKGMEGLARRASISWYGTSDGVLALTSTVATQASGTYALLDGFGQSDIDDTTYLASLFQKGDHVALIRSAAIVANSVGGEITAEPTTSGLAITWTGSVGSNANDQIVMANSAGWGITTPAITHTDYNLAPVGWMNALKTASVHGLSSATAPLWNTAYGDTAGGIISGTRLKRGQHEIANKGGGTANLLILDQGVERKLYETTSAAVQFNDPLNMEVLGEVQTRSIQQFSSRYVPPGYAIMCDKRTVTRWTMVPMPDDDATSVEGMENANEDKLQDLNAKVVSLDFPYAWVWTNRGNNAYWRSLTTA